MQQKFISCSLHTSGDRQGELYHYSHSGTQADGGFTLTPTLAISAAGGRGPGESHTVSKGFCLEMTCVTSIHILLAKASHMAIPNMNKLGSALLPCL